MTHAVPVTRNHYVTNKRRYTISIIVPFRQEGDISLCLPWRLLGRPLERRRSYSQGCGTLPTNTRRFRRTDEFMVAGALLILVPRGVCSSSSVAIKNI